ncbi:MAG: hypothetical protein KJ864_01955 [Candidatus Omnitrophica bacterium]|nr:hypothetical protein [Candidatus Omnitrophota bacterium]
MEDAEKDGASGVQMEDVIGQYAIGEVTCRECGENVMGAIGRRFHVPLLHILETGKDCLGVGQMQEAPLVKLALFYALMSWVALRKIARFRLRLPIW